MIFEKGSDQRAIKYRTIRLREEVAQQLDEWKDLFEDASMSEAMWRIFALARRELKRVKEKKRRANQRFLKERQAIQEKADLEQKL